MRKSKTNVYERMHIESSKMVLMDLFAGQQGRHRHREQWGTVVDTVGEGEGGMD